MAQLGTFAQWYLLGRPALIKNQLGQGISENSGGWAALGGSSSGRYRTRNRGAVEQVQRLDIRQLRRRGYVRRGSSVSGSWSWTCRGEPSGSVSVFVNVFDLDDAHMRVSFRFNGEPREQYVRIEAAPCRLGGHRFYFICPKTHDRCEVLCLVGGVFASRQAHRLNYYSQSEDRLGRMHRARAKAEERLHPKDGRPKPRGKNRERLVERWIALEVASEELFASEVIRRFGLKWKDELGF